MNLVRTVICLGCVITFLFSVSATAQKKPAFPSIRPAHLSFAVEGKRTIEKKLVIRTLQNRTAYRLTISAVYIGKQDFETIELDLNGIGSPATRFDTKYESNLLNPERRPDVHGMTGLSWMDFKQHRNLSMVFRLRRMKITLTVSDVVLNADDGIKTAKVVVDVEPDANTDSRPAGFSEPSQFSFHKKRAGRVPFGEGQPALSRAHYFYGN